MACEEEFDPVDDKTDEDEDNNESSKRSSNANTFSVLETIMGALDKKLAFRTRERRKFEVFTGEEKDIFEVVSRVNSASEKESVLLKEDQNDLDSLRTVSGGKAIFGSSAAIELIFEAMPRVNSRLVKLTTLIVKGERFKVGQKDHCSF
ncbi:hypothetical protein TNCV_1793091 [Trichonephila clavipes]|nr:hypothetical protein TNCV_1793091 [Trichonephila clavipes]